MLAIVNSTAVNMRVQVSLFSFPLNKYLEMGLLDHTVILFLKKDFV